MGSAFTDNGSLTVGRRQKHKRMEKEMGRQLLGMLIKIYFIHAQQRHEIM